MLMNEAKQPNKAQSKDLKDFVDKVSQESTCRTKQQTNASDVLLKCVCYTIEMLTLLSHQSVV